MLAVHRSWRKLSLVLVSIAAAFMLMTSLSPATASAAPSHQCSKSSFGFFGLEPWYQYLPYSYSPITDHCEINEPPNANDTAQPVLGRSSFILLIVLAVIDDLLRIAGIVAVVFVIIGGFKFITSAGEPEAAVKARQSIIFALVGLVIALIATVVVSFIGNSLGA